ncbi:reverse transcriptase family protein [Pseudidiomarina terrestris]|uniref:reverse transcriptase family protein n=1 Tax=Pseudidiomarina terrestris TaxID=2820060 RepID=UPI0026527306|nr:reverse transcriptase family protein [Pseudidiomarina sp. 1ASP75-5]MDN7136390.1 RNA-directed DNA polymerase [Pseudidiomarina sp. 1ASP75-5]
MIYPECGYWWLSQKFNYMENIKYKSTERISNADSLFNLLGVDEDYVNGLIASKDKLYKVLRVPKKNSRGHRVVYSVDRKLKKLQSLINSRIFSQLIFPLYLQGSISDPDNKRDYLRCASIHCPSVLVTSIDIKNFFDEIMADKVNMIFNDFMSFPDDVSHILTEICTYNGTVPQGAPTSSFIANLVFYKDEFRIAQFAQSSGFRYTRLLDDITISTPKKFRTSSQIEQRVRRMIKDEGFTVNEEKSKTETVSGGRLSVHGMVVTGTSPKLTKKRYREIKAFVLNVVNDASQNSFRQTHIFYKNYHKASGLLSILKRVEHPAYKKLRAKLKRVKPLPSKVFYNSIVSRTGSLESKDAELRSEPWFVKSHQKLMYELGILGRSYPTEAQRLRKRLNEIAP